MQTQNPITPQIEQTINYYTNRLARSFRLQPADKDDVRQELTLKALEAMQCYTSDMEANIETYTKHALRRKAIDLAGAIIASPSLSGIDTESDIAATETNTDLVIDVQSIIETLTHRQQKICAMLIAGHIQEEIAAVIGIKRQNVQKHIVRIRRHFSFICKSKFTGCNFGLISV